MRIEQPFRGSVLYAGIVMPDYLLVTEAPGTILDTFSFGDARDKPTLLNKRFSQLDNVPKVVFKRPAGLETIMLQRPGAVLTWNATADQLDAVGLPAIGLRIAAEQDIFKRAEIYAALVHREDRQPFLND